MIETPWYDAAATVATILTPILLVIISGLGWAFKTSIERANRLEQSMRQDRLKIYQIILEPFVVMFTKDEAALSGSGGMSEANQEKALKMVLSKEYREAAFNLALFANDDVLQAFNAMFQSAYKIDSSTTSSFDLIFKMGDLLLAIRKSVGNETTRIKNYEMLKWMINDIEQYVDNNGNPLIS